MLIAILSNPIIVGDSSALFPNVSFPADGPSPEWLAENNATTVISTLPYDQTHQVMETVEPYLNDGVVYVVIVREMTPEEQMAYDNNLRGSNGRKAANLLSDTDWVDLPSVSNPSQPVYLENVSAFNIYRTELRVIAVNPPVIVAEWPVKPNEIWITNPEVPE